MPERRKKLSVGGKEFDATPVTPVSSQEPWATYLLDDGTTVRLKVVVKSILRIENLYDQEGNPVYVVNSTNILDTDSPESLRRKK